MPLVQHIYTKTVKVLETQGNFLLIPVKEDNMNCPFYGMFADGKISSYKFIERKQNEMELEK